VLRIPSVRLTLVMNGTWTSSARPYIRKKIKKYFATEDQKNKTAQRVPCGEAPTLHDVDLRA